VSLNEHGENKCQDEAGREMHVFGELSVADDRLDPFGLFTREESPPRASSVIVINPNTDPHRHNAVVGLTRVKLSF
jgi:hypothetical protein